MFQVNPRANKTDFAVVTATLVASVAFAVAAFVFFAMDRTEDAFFLLVPAIAFTAVSGRGLAYVFRFGGKR